MINAVNESESPVKLSPQIIKQLKINDIRSWYIAGKNFVVHGPNGSLDKNLSIRVNSDSAWSFNVHHPNELELYSNGKREAVIHVPNNYRVSDITDKMYELNDKAGGERLGMTKEDYLAIYKIYLEMH